MKETTILRQLKNIKIAQRQLLQKLTKNNDNSSFNQEDSQSKDFQSKDFQSRDIQSKDIQSKDVAKEKEISILDKLDNLIKIESKILKHLSNSKNDSNRNSHRDSHNDRRRDGHRDKRRDGNSNHNNYNDNHRDLHQSGVHPSEWSKFGRNGGWSPQGGNMDGYGWGNTGANRAMSEGYVLNSMDYWPGYAYARDNAPFFWDGGGLDKYYNNGDGEDAQKWVSESTCHAAWRYSMERDPAYTPPFDVYRQLSCSLPRQTNYYYS